jgi:hypothetical protein
MYSLTPDEKTSSVMVYTHNSLVRGELVTRQNVRVSVWLRTEGASEYMHVLNAHIVYLTGSSVKIQSYPELFLPTSEVVAFHLTPPAQDPLDYDESEMNRRMQPLSILVGSFIFNGAIRISTQVDLGTSISSGRAVWLSMYDVKVSNPYLPQMGEIPVPMLVMRPGQVTFALNE